jgi:hypothetical protein
MRTSAYLLCLIAAAPAPPSRRLPAHAPVMVSWGGVSSFVSLEARGRSVRRLYLYQVFEYEGRWGYDGRERDAIVVEEYHEGRNPAVLVYRFRLVRGAWAQEDRASTVGKK